MNGVYNSMDNNQNNEVITTEAVTVQEATLEAATPSTEPISAPAGEPQVNEEQLRRTYKGIIFKTEEEKDQMIALEEEISNYCENLEGKTYKELYDKNQELNNLPKAIFSPLSIKIMTAANEREKVEIEEYKVKVAELSLEELEEAKAEAEAQNYSYGAMSQISGFILNRKRECQTKILEDMLTGYDSISRNELKELKTKISELNFEANLVSPFLNKIDVQYDIVEQDELQSLCANVESMEINELEALLRIINDGGYQQKYSASYITMINNRIEHLQYLELEALTTCKEEMSKQELMDLYAKLEQGGYNPKFIKRFLLDVRMLIENRKYMEVMELTADVYNKSKDEVLNVESIIEETGYSQGILMVPRRKIADKRFEFDMCELIDGCNDFDSLSNEEADTLIASVNEKNYSQKSKNIYLDRISQRKMNIALGDVSRLAAYFVQLANKYGVGGGDILVASKSDAFMAAYRNLKNAYPTSGEYDIPAFIMNGGVNIAISYKYCYLNAGSKQTLLEINNINGMKTVKKLFMESLVMELKNGTTVPVSGSINKQILAGFLQMINEFIANVNNTAVIDSFSMPEFNVDALNKEWYICKDENYGLTKSELKACTIGAMCADATTNEIAKAMHFEGNKDWDQYHVKVKTNYQLLPSDELVFVFDKSLLNNAKEGFAVGTEKLYIKLANQPVIALNFNEIFEIRCDASGKICVDTTGANTNSLDMVTCSASCAIFMANKLNEYVRNMQLYSTIAE